MLFWTELKENYIFLDQVIFGTEQDSDHKPVQTSSNWFDW